MATYLIQYNEVGGATFSYKRYTGFSGTVNSSFALSQDMGGACWDGTNAIWGAGTVGASASIKKGTGFSSSIQASFAAPSAADRIYDLHSDESDNIYVAENTTKLWRMTGFSSTVSASFTKASASFRGVSFDGTDAYAYDATTSHYIRFTGFTSSISSSYSGTPDGGRGVAWSTTDSAMLGSNGPKAVKFVGFSSSVSSSISITANSLGIFWDAGAAAGPVNWKTYNTVTVATNLKTLNTNTLANIKSYDTIV